MRCSSSLAYAREHCISLLPVLVTGASMSSTNSTWTRPRQSYVGHPNRTTKMASELPVAGRNGNAASEKLELAAGPRFASVVEECKVVIGVAVAMNLVTNKPTSSALPTLRLGGSSLNNFQMVLFGRRKLKFSSEMSQNAKTVVIDTPTPSAPFSKPTRRNHPRTQPCKVGWRGGREEGSTLQPGPLDPDVKVCVFRYGPFCV